MNEPGHPHSALFLELRFANRGTSAAEVSCFFDVSARDYRNVPAFGNGSAALSRAGASEEASTLTVQPNETASCSFALSRSNETYAQFAATDLDVARGDLPASMEYSERAYMLLLRGRAVVNNGAQVFEDSVRKVLCTPEISTRNGATCEGRIGRWTMAEEDLGTW